MTSRTSSPTADSPTAEALEDRVKSADFSQSRNDMYWKVWAGDDKFIRWIGYDDDNWWRNVAPTAGFRERVGPVTGRTYRLDPETSSVTVVA